MRIFKHKGLFLKNSPVHGYGLKEKESLWTTNGYCSHLNHSTKHNVIWSIDQDKMIASFVACQNILPGEELFINYHLEM